jgi:hypothetical protein
MTTRGLIIGTSHTAALRQGWRAAPLPGLELTFAALQGEMADFQVIGTTLTATDPAKLARFSGQPGFDLTPYDVIALCGGTPSTFHAARLYGQTRWPALPSARAAPLSAPNLISAQCFERALSGLIGTAPGFALMSLIRAASPARLFAIPHPALSAQVLTQTRQHQIFAQIHRNGDAPALARMMDRAARRACGDLAHYVPPPPQVRQDGFFTHPAFRRGATRLGTDDSLPQPPEDHLHGNAAYGHHVLSGLHACL